MKMDRQRRARLRHALGMFRTVRSFLEAHPEACDVSVRCSDGTFRMSALLLAAMSPTLREALRDSCSSDSGSCNSCGVATVVVSEGWQLSVNDLAAFFELLLGERRYRAAVDLPSLRRVCLALQVKKLFLPAAIFNDDEEADEDLDAPQNVFPAESRDRTATSIASHPFRNSSLDQSEGYESLSSPSRSSSNDNSNVAAAGLIPVPAATVDSVADDVVADDVAEELDFDDPSSLAVRTDVRPLTAPCLYCSAKFQGCQLLRAHVRERHPSRLLHCMMCDRRTESQTELFQHIQSHADEPGNIFFPCKFCKMNFSVRYDLRTHIRRSHRPHPAFRCQECGKAFYNAKVLSQHVAREHGGKITKKYHFCPHCDKKFRYYGLLERHVRAHLGARSFVCESCGQGFMDEPSLFAHRDRAHLTRSMAAGAGQGHDKMYGCDLCDQVFPLKGYLMRHLRSEEHRENEARQAVREIIDNVRAQELQAQANRRRDYDEDDFEEGEEREDDYDGGGRRMDERQETELAVSHLQQQQQHPHEEVIEERECNFVEESLAEMIQVDNHE